MDDFSHLIKRKSESDEGKGLLSDDTKPEEAKALLDKMKEISELIKNVSTIYYYKLKLVDFNLFSNNLFSLNLKIYIIYRELSPF